MVIYKTTNLINGKFYVGKDVRNLNCYLGSGKLLKKAIEKYGKHNFVKEILEVCDNLTKLEEREKHWIRELDSIKNGYNLTEGGTGGDTFTNNSNKEEIRNKLKKRVYSEEVKKIKLNNLTPFQFGENHPNFGKKQSQETIEKRLISFQKKGFNSPFEGKNHTEETKQKIREKKIGIIISEDTKEKMRNSSNKGEKQRILICPYCNKQGGGNSMFRWHFENCKNK
jgi:group I intron endonuclease